MVQKRYEISDEQWIKIENLFPIAKTIVLCSMQSYGLQGVELHGVIYRNVLVHGKLYTAVFVSGAIMALY